MIDIINPYRKFYAAVLATILSAVVAASTDGAITHDEWVNVAIAGVSACAVFTAPNVPYARYTKSVIAVLMAVLTLLVSFISDGVSTPELLQLVIAGLGALGVYGVSNKSADDELLDA